MLRTLYVIQSLFVLGLPGALAAEYLKPMPRYQHTMEVVNGQLCVFGGKGDATGTGLSAYLLDFRCVDVTKPVRQSSPKWVSLSSASRFAMPPLALHTSVYYRRNHIIVPYGGKTPTGFSKSSSLAVFCTQYQAWGASTFNDTTFRVYSHTAVLQESSGDMIIFGGLGFYTPNEVYYDQPSNPLRMVLDSEMHAQHAVARGDSTNMYVDDGAIFVDYGDAVPANISRIINHASVLIDDRYMVVMGGAMWNGPADYTSVSMDTVFVYDVDTHKWSNRTCTGDVPPFRSSFAVAKYRDSIFIFGGVDASNWLVPFNNLHQLNTTTWTWTDLSTPTAPAPRYAHQMKAIGDYLVITHGYLANKTGDPSIYFYSIKDKAFVDTYSPKGIPLTEIDAKWINPLSHATKGVISVSFIAQIAAGILACFYVCRGFTRRVALHGRARESMHSARNRARAKVVSYAENVKNPLNLPFTRAAAAAGGGGDDGQRVADAESGKSMLLAPRSNRFKPRPSAGEEAGAVYRGRINSASEATSTVVGSSSMPNRPGNLNMHGGPYGGMRHSRIIDGALPSTGPYISRKLTVSARLPSYVDADYLGYLDSNERSARLALLGNGDQGAAMDTSSSSYLLDYAHTDGSSMQNVEVFTLENSSVGAAEVEGRGFGEGPAGLRVVNDSLRSP
ncbi:hypothetical protein GQ54DRAFT_8420 [Martensiomyces pterosporus]|nr:hypothetical protein GQ54DRAFT_8420 [Martensiomyces pterosporus]